MMFTVGMAIGLVIGVTGMFIVLAAVMRGDR